jgi:hypothetical protein
MISWNKIIFHSGATRLSGVKLFRITIRKLTVPEYIKDGLRYSPASPQSRKAKIYDSKVVKRGRRVEVKPYKKLFLRSKVKLRTISFNANRFTTFLCRKEHCVSNARRKNVA